MIVTRIEAEIILEAISKDALKWSDFEVERILRMLTGKEVTIEDYSDKYAEAEYDV